MQQQGNVGEGAHQDIEQDIHQGIFRKTSVYKRENKIQYQDAAAQYGNDEVRADAPKAYEVFRPDRQQGIDQHGLKENSGNTVMVAQVSCQEPQAYDNPCQHRDAPVEMGFLQYQKVYRRADDAACQQKELHKL